MSEERTVYVVLDHGEYGDDNMPDEVYEKEDDAKRHAAALYSGSVRRMLVRTQVTGFVLNMEAQRR
jgi:hypothetical protein